MLQHLADLAADTSGKLSEASSLVLLHGLTFDRTMWGPTREHLMYLEPGRLVVAFDLPGHGQSPPQTDYNVETVAAAIHHAVSETGEHAPVVVGHSVSGLIATMYAARYPTRGVVNVDQPLDITQFATLVRSLEDRLRGPDFSELWATFEASFHTELLPGRAQELVQASSPPDQAIVLGYWNQIFDLPIAALNAMVDDAIATLRTEHLPYTFVSGRTVDPSYEQWLRRRLPEAQIIVLPNSGHFPQLAHPAAFAEVLHETITW
jgi:pimeloyl-ACP methyl ester carboxylesterase